MALLFIDGFDALGSDGLAVMSTLQSSGYSVGGASETSIQTKSDTRTGIGFSLQVPTQSAVTRSFVTTNAIVWGAGIKIGGTGIGGIFAVLYNNLLGTIDTQLLLFANGENGISATTGDSDLVAASAPNVLFPGVWQYFECKYTPSATSGSLEVKIDGSVVLSVSSVKTAYHSAPELCNQLQMGGSMEGIGNNVTCNYDDWYIENQSGGAFDTYLGDVVVAAVFPNADEGTNQMTQFGGGVGHFTSIDEQTPDDDASYVYSNTSAQKELYNLGALPSDVIDVLAVAVNVRAKKDAAGVGSYSAALVVSSTETDSDAIPVSVGYLMSQFIVVTPPGGGSWTKTKAQNASIGVVMT